MTASGMPQAGPLRVCERCGRSAGPEVRRTRGATLCAACAAASEADRPAVPTRRRARLDAVAAYAVSLAVHAAILVIFTQVAWLIVSHPPGAGEAEVGIVTDPGPTIEASRSQVLPVDVVPPPLAVVPTTETASLPPVTISSAVPAPVPSASEVGLDAGPASAGSPGAWAVIAVAGAGPALGGGGQGGGTGRGDGFGDLAREFGVRLAREGAKTGDIQVSLLWGNYNDIDLHVVCPSGEIIFFGHQNSACGGELDVDMNAGGRQSNKPVENVYWPPGGAPRGHYEVRVHHYANHGDRDPTPYTVQVVVEAKRQMFSGRLMPNQTQPVYAFDYPERPPPR